MDRYNGVQPLIAFLAIHLDPQVASAIGALCLGVASLATVVTGFVNRAKLWAYIVDRIALKNLYDASEKRVNGLQQSIESMERGLKAEKQTREAQDATIELLKSEVADLKIIKRKFIALLKWITEMLDYVGFLERLVPPSQLHGRKMPPLPLILRDDIDFPDLSEVEAPNE